MRMNALGLALLRKYETCSLTAYWDIDGYSIGWGHHSPDITKDTVWTQAQADAALVADIVATEVGMTRLILVNLTDNQWSAIVDFTYNEGQGHLHGSTLLTFLNANHPLQAAAELPKWRYAGGRPNTKLLERRLDEQNLFMLPDAA